MVLNPQLRAKLIEMLVIELLLIVNNDNLWYSESTYDGIPDKVAYVTFSYRCQRFGLDPLCEIIYNHHQKFPLSRCQGKRPHNVYAPLSEGPWARNGYEMFCWLSKDTTESLTAIASSNKIHCIILHCWLVVSCSNQLMDKGPTFTMIFTYSFMNLLHDVLSFGW